MSEFPRINSFVIPPETLVSEVNDDNAVTLIFPTEAAAQEFRRFCLAVPNVGTTIPPSRTP